MIEWVRRQPELRSTALVVFSGSDDPAHKEKAYSLGANDYRIKPTQFKEFTCAVKEIAESWLVNR